MALFVIGYDDDGGYGVSGDDDVDIFYALPDTLSKVVVFIFIAVELWLSPHSLLCGGDDDVLLP